MSKITKLIEATWRYGSAPTLESLLGPDGASAEWRVTMLTGLIPNLPTWRKLFLRPVGGGIIGANVLRKDWMWGYFRVLPHCPTPGESELVIDYDHSHNNRITRRIRDLVRTTPDPNMLIGKFHLVWRGKWRFLGYFTLTRI